jgi:acyl-CoA reductase-like NAD-dependent aldehyde dehydrogenase
MMRKLASHNDPGPSIDSRCAGLIESAHHVAHHETFAPILYVLSYEDLDEAIALNNAVPQGLSSAISTLDMRQAERFMAADGSDCGIDNLSIRTSGAEIGGAIESC